MSDGLFGDLDVASADDNPFEVPDNTYNCTVTDVKVAPTKNGDKVGMTIIYTIQDGDHATKTISEWKHIPDPGDKSAEASRATSFLKSRLNDLGIPEERMNSVTREDLLGIDCTVSTKTKDGFTNVRKVVLGHAVVEAESGFSGAFA